MARDGWLELLTTIRHPASLDEQVAALKQLKHTIIGHDQRKSLLVSHGAVQILLNILSSTLKASGKRRAGETNGVPTHQSVTSPWSREDDLRQEATLILGTLASGGRFFAAPLLAAETHIRLLEGLQAGLPPKLVTSSLQALSNLAVSAVSSDGDWMDSTSLRVFVDAATTCFPHVRHATNSADAWQRFKLITQIISATATDHTSRSELVDSGVLENLATCLVSHVLGSKQLDYRGAYDFGPPPPVLAVPNILSAIAAIITGSNYRAQSFIHSESIHELFADATPYADSSTRSGSHSAVESLLPPLHVPPTKSVTFSHGSSSFPALRSLQQSNRTDPAVGTTQQIGDVEHSNAVCAWLISIARSMEGLSRLAALKLLALVNNAINDGSEFVGHRSEMVQRAREREKQVSMLAIPLAVNLIQTALDPPSGDSPAQQREHRSIKEQACQVLALLIKDNKELQVAAVDANAIKWVCPLLKKSFDSVTFSKPMWSARPFPDESPDTPASCRMGSKGILPEIEHAMRCRQGALQAIAAIARKEDVHRKAIIDAGVISCIVDSLKPFAPDAFVEHPANRNQVTSKDGNTKPVLLAACSAAQSMSRSVSLLRTSLIDAKITTPIFELLQKYQDLDVKIAATDVLTNLVLEFSPMRKDLVDIGVLKTLCEHTRQSDLGLRLSSLWALKHLVLSSDQKMKKECLEELGTGWLVGAIQGESTQHVPIAANGGVSIGGGGLSAPNAAGEQVDLLNPTSMDVDDPPDMGDDDLDEGEDEDDDGEMMYDEDTGTHYQASGVRSTLRPPNRAPSPPFSAEQYLSTVREIEQDPILRAKRMDTAVQEQALDFVRNMLNGEDCKDMITHLLSQIGTEKFFALLVDKLSPIASVPASATSAHQRPVYNPTELVLGTIHVITHIANGTPKQKATLIAQTPLLRAWVPHFNHPDRRVRVICVWAVNSLTWTDEEKDRDDARRRARELRIVGIENAVRSLSNDHDLDVRERVRTSVRQFEGV